MVYRQATDRESLCVVYACQRRVLLAQRLELARQNFKGAYTILNTGSLNIGPSFRMCQPLGKYSNFKIFLDYEDALVSLVNQKPDPDKSSLGL